MTDNCSSLLVVGTGAMACLFAAHLSAAKIPVTMMGSWSEGLDALNKHGVRLVDADGKEQAYPVHVTPDCAECTGISYALVLVKSWQTERAANQLAVCLPPNGVALTLQNGMGNHETLIRALGGKRVALGATTAGAYLLGPGRVQVAGEGVISLSIHAQLKPLADMLGTAGFVVETVPDPLVLLWGKLVINAAINPITALLKIPNGEILQRPTARALCASVAREAAAVAVGKGVRLPYPDPVVATETIARRTAKNRSSMLQDVERGAPTEIDAINGAIVEMGEQIGLPTPLNRTLWSLIKALENRKTS